MTIKSFKKDLFRNLIINLAHWVGVDLLMLAYKEQGILNSGPLVKTGEQYFLDQILPKYLKTNRPVLFDVGGDTGETPLALYQKYPQATMYVFEPNPIAFKKMKTSLDQRSVDIVVENIGLGAIRGHRKLFRYSKYKTGLVTTAKEALAKLYQEKSRIEEVPFYCETVDNYCKQKRISSIDLLRIDVEGEELNVLHGASKMINRGKIKLIQFEFNNFNVFGRVFLKDFYDFLAGYYFFRLTKSGLISLGDYNTTNEIFLFQNILAIQKKLYRV